MLSDGQLLLKAICADPDADLPRLVYADYLDDEGQPERAALIRLQCEFERKLRLVLGFDEAVRREEVALWTAHGSEWLAELPLIKGVVWDTAFYRGFVKRVTVRTDTLLLRHADAILDRNPISHLIIEKFTGAAGVTRLPGFRHLKTAFFNIPQSSEQVVEELLAWDEFRPTLVLRLDNFGSPTASGYGALREKFLGQLA